MRASGRLKGKHVQKQGGDDALPGEPCEPAACPPDVSVDPCGTAAAPLAIELLPDLSAQLAAL